MRLACAALFAIPLAFAQANTMEDLKPLLHEVSSAYSKLEPQIVRPAEGYFAIGDADSILARIAEYVAAGVCKFILRPMGSDDAQVLLQTRHLIEQVLPGVAARWPRLQPATT